jgi:hypothetical protein
MRVIRRNVDVLAEAPVSEWTPNLKGKGLPDVVVDAIRRLHSDQQALAQRVEAVKTTAVVETPKPVLNTFTELSIGSPATAGGGSVRFRVGLGDPETVIEGSAMRDVWLQVDGAVGRFFWLKETGEGKTGWVVKF